MADKKDVSADIAALKRENAELQGLVLATGVILTQLLQSNCKRELNPQAAAGRIMGSAREAIEGFTASTHADPVMKARALEAVETNWDEFAALLSGRPSGVGRAIPIVGMARAGADVLCAPAAFTKQTGEAHWHALLKARAIENGAFVIAAAQGGVHEDGRATFGHSLIIGPWGECLAEADSAEPGVILAEIDPARARDARARIPNLALENEIGVRVVGP